jgi:hypothetical protein
MRVSFWRNVSMPSRIAKEVVVGAMGTGNCGRGWNGLSGLLRYDLGILMLGTASGTAFGTRFRNPQRDFSLENVDCESVHNRTDAHVRGV